MKNISLVDSHCHLNLLDLTLFNHSMDEVIAQAHANGVDHLLSVCCELDDLPALHQLSETYQNISISTGIHPNTIMSAELDAEALISLANHPACIAIGETGLDYYRTETDAARLQQAQRFREHIAAARATSKPLIIHTRQAAEDTLQLMVEEGAADIGGVMHCFSETWDIARQALDLNFYISFSGIVTFKNAQNLQELVQKVPLERILIETDSPYLAPMPFRGQQNHPALVKHVAEKLAQLLKLDLTELAALTTENFYRCFRIAR
jgi:TatD DNase family protein